MLRRDFVYQDVQSVQIPPCLDTNDALPAYPVGHEIARGGEEERFGSEWPGPCRGFVDADVDLLADVADLGAVRPDARKMAHERRLVGDDLADEPLLERVLHDRSIQSGSLDHAS